MWIYLNDRFVPEEEAKVSIFDHGFLYGDGLFETVRAYSGRIFALSEHLDRLSHSADRLEILLPPRASLETLLYETLRQNQLNNAMLRLTITRGEAGIGLAPNSRPKAKTTLVITPRLFDGYAAEYYKNGVSAAIVSVRRNSPDALDPALKSLSFLNNVMAKIEATKKGAFEGIFLDLKGRLSEGTTSNLFWLQDGVIKTPAARASILEGITRGVVLGLAKKTGISLKKGCYLPEELLGAEEAFLTNTGLELMPLTKVNGKKIGTGLPGGMTRRLHQAFKEVVGLGACRT
ncbi:MAG: aminotransferase class IV [Nitrospira sp.]|nr:branched-chain amino acid aminotransferase [Candidatus Manganitrophaceae bacterium]HIL35232.1 branched-chain amino acid aminotransferase [Candidatus Manganitrophaceae bacterium]